MCLDFDSFMMLMSHNIFEFHFNFLIFHFAFLKLELEVSELLNFQQQSFLSLFVLLDFSSVSFTFAIDLVTLVS